MKFVNSALCTVFDINKKKAILTDFEKIPLKSLGGG